MQIFSARRPLWGAISSWVSVLLAFAGAQGVLGQQSFTLCTEESLRSIVQIGGSYRLDCSTNNLVNITISQPFIVERDLALVSTQEVLLDGKGLTRLFVVRPGVRLTLDRILIFSGRQSPTNANNGGIDDTAGGGIYNDGGIITILNSRFEGNSVLGVTGAAGAEAGDDGEPGGDAAGAAIYNNGGQIVISNTTFAVNTVTPGVGGAGAAGGGGFGGDGGDGGNGGSSGGAAIYSQGGSIVVLNSTFTNNLATGGAAGAGGAAAGILGFPGEPGEAGDGVGAAIVGANASLVITGCTFVTNKVTGANGLAGKSGLRNLEGSLGRRGGEAAGAAVYSTGTLRMTNCTLFANVATGGNGGAGGAGGSSGFGGDGGNGGDGGTASGAVETSGLAEIINCTFSDNAAIPGSGGLGGQGAMLGEDGRDGSAPVALGAALHAAGAEAVLANNILAGSGLTASGSVSDRGGNLATDRNSLISSPLSLRLASPFLRPLAANGGPTLTMALQTNSPALGRAVNEFCPPIDQRGTNRVACDIGAYELNLGLPPIPASVFTNLTVVRRTNNLVQLRWPAGYTNLYLQFKTNLNRTNWSTLFATGLSTNLNGSFVLQITNNNPPQAFFRLVGITNLLFTNLVTLPAN